jgi:hypothetical protein
VADRVLVVRDGQHHMLAKKRAVVATAQMERHQVACSGNALPRKGSTSDSSRRNSVSTSRTIE